MRHALAALLLACSLSTCGTTMATRPADSDIEPSPALFGHLRFPQPG